MYRFFSHRYLNKYSKQLHSIYIMSSIISNLEMIKVYGRKLYNGFSLFEVDSSCVAPACLELCIAQAGLKLIAIFLS